MKKAIMYGAGNIGRGFIGALFSESGYHVDFVDVAKPVIEALNKDHSYPVRHVSTSGFDEVLIENVSGIDGTNSDLVSDAIAECDLMATAVGVNILKFIVPNIALGLRKRFARGAKPMNIIICENLMDANKIVEKMIKENLTEGEGKTMDRTIGLVEASIGRMVPVQTPEMQDGNPLRVCVESYGFLPVDKGAMKGSIPKIKNLVPEEPFDFFIKRKLYVHNMGHATTAYLGDYLDLEYIYQAIDDENIKLIAANAMQESAIALSRKYGKDLSGIIMHINDLIYRFSNKALMDTCKRVGNDQKRKLASSDRMIGSSLLCQEMKIAPIFISVGTAAAVYRYLEENGIEQCMDACKKTLEELSCLKPEYDTSKLIFKFYDMLIQKKTVKEIRKAAEEMRSRIMTGIV